MYLDPDFGAEEKPGPLGPEKGPMEGSESLYVQIFLARKQLLSLHGYPGFWDKQRRLWACLEGM